MWIDDCPNGDQGMIRPLVTNDGQFALMCDVGNEVWRHPDDIGTVEPAYPRSPDWAVDEDLHVQPGTWRWAGANDLVHSGWDADWKPGPDNYPPGT